MKTLISSIIIAKNEEKNIAHCLQSLSWTSECIVVDNGSTDKTVVIAKHCGAKILSILDNDFSIIRNAGANVAKGEWLLYIDADEEITQTLKDEIESIVVSKDTNSAYIIPRKNYFLGKNWPFRDGMIRLIKKSALKGWIGKVHESASVNGTVGSLNESLIHKTHKTLEEMVEKTNDWSEIESDLRFSADHPPIVPWRIFRVVGTGFIESYVHQRGWKAGTVGFIEGLYQGFSMGISYLKLWEKQQNNKN